MTDRTTQIVDQYRTVLNFSPTLKEDTALSEMLKTILTSMAIHTDKINELQDRIAALEMENRRLTGD